MIYTLELTLWHPASRYDRALIDATFAPDFHEFGRSGRRYTRAELLDAAPRDFTATLHEATITLTTYIPELHTAEGPERANRSSTWDNASGRWQLRFHQGTPCP
jgi:hypothetical protein